MIIHTYNMLSNMSTQPEANRCCLLGGILLQRSPINVSRALCYVNKRRRIGLRHVARVLSQSYPKFSSLEIKPCRGFLCVGLTEEMGKTRDKRPGEGFRTMPNKIVCFLGVGEKSEGGVCCCCCCFLHINRSGLNHTQ